MAVRGGTAGCNLIQEGVRGANYHAGEMDSAAASRPIQQRLSGDSYQLAAWQWEALCLAIAALSSEPASIWQRGGG